MPGASFRNTGGTGEVDCDLLKVAGVQITATPAELNALDGITATVAELNTVDGFTGDSTDLNEVDGMVASFSFAAAAGAANITEVTVTAQDAQGATVAAPILFDIWLSDAATGAGLTATTASGTVTAKSASGEVVGTYTAKKALRVQALATGVFILEITDTAKTGFYVCAQTGHAEVKVSTQLVSGDYGA